MGVLTWVEVVACQFMVVRLTRGGICAKNRTALSLQACNVKTPGCSGSSRSKQLCLQCPSCASARRTAEGAAADNGLLQAPHFQLDRRTQCCKPHRLQVTPSKATCCKPFRQCTPHNLTCPVGARTKCSL